MKMTRRELIAATAVLPLAASGQIPETKPDLSELDKVQIPAGTEPALVFRA